MSGRAGADDGQRERDERFARRVLRLPDVEPDDAPAGRPRSRVNRNGAGRTTGRPRLTPDESFAAGVLGSSPDYAHVGRWLARGRWRRPT